MRHRGRALVLGGRALYQYRAGRAAFDTVRMFVAWHWPGSSTNTGKAGVMSSSDRHLAIPGPDMADFIAGLPKAELHLHIEGTLEPEMMFRLAARNKISLPYPSVEALREAYDFENLQSFLDLYYQGMGVLRTETDFYDITWAYLTKVHAQHVRHAEIFFDPQGHTNRGVSFETVMSGICRALDDATCQLGITTRLIACFLRDRDAHEAMATLDQVLRHRDRIVGVGLDSAERGHPPAKFEEVFERARMEGLLKVAHAGEEGPASYVRDALDLLGVARVDHGNRSMEDPALIDRLVRERVPLTLCPLSNLRLRVIGDLRDHPLRAMMEKGMLVTINSDDPAYFGGYVNENYAAVQEALGLTQRELVQLARNSFNAAFLTEAEKQTLLRQVEDYAVARPVYARRSG
jgi:adenosine deaminase